MAIPSGGILGYRVHRGNRSVKNYNSKVPNGTIIANVSIIIYFHFGFNNDFVYSLRITQFASAIDRENSDLLSFKSNSKYILEF
jgi:hypothetical protein